MPFETKEPIRRNRFLNENPEYIFFEAAMRSHEEAKNTATPSHCIKDIFSPYRKSQAIHGIISPAVENIDERAIVPLFIA